MSLYPFISQLRLVPTCSFPMPVGTAAQVPTPGWDSQQILDLLRNIPVPQIVHT